LLSPSSLLSIVALARSGSLDLAWRRLEALQAPPDDPAVLTIRGRLLKDRALAAAGDARRVLYGQAAEAYARAGEIQGNATYPFINAATLSLLAGDRAAAARRAQRVLDLIDRGEDGPETPYWREATQAEALLLLGRAAETRASFAAAIAQASEAWEDHASTLRQFRLIHEALGEDASWLDAHRPPRTLHFGGHMALAADTADLAAEVTAVLAAERVGFGYGALAAGADIVVAEALLARGAELHLVLPAPPDAFRVASVEPIGGDWAARSDAVLARAETVRVAGSRGGGAAANQLATEVAMGCAVMQARMLETEAVQLIVLDDGSQDEGEPGSSAWMGAAWRSAGRRGRVLTSPRASAGAGSSAGGEGRLVAQVEVRLGALSPASAAALASAAGAGLLGRPQWRADGLSLVFAEAGSAALAMVGLARVGGEAGVRIAGAYGVVEAFDDPFGGGDAVLCGGAVGLAERILASTPPGAVHVSADFACALAASPAAAQAHTEHVGELPGDDPQSAAPIHALRPRPA